MPRPPTRTPDAPMPLGISPRTLFVTGKGGVGKSTVTAALAIAYREAGVRTLLVELAGQEVATSLISDRTPAYEPIALGRGLHALRIDRDSALREYARLRLKLRLVADRLVGNPIIDQFAQAAPGLGELLVLGKLWSLALEVDSRRRPRYEAIIVDAPATGHGLGLLGMAGTVARMFPVGPIANEAREVDAFVRDPKRVGAVVVTLPEEMPVNETIDLCGHLGRQGVNVAAVVLNALLPDRFSDDEADSLASRLERRLGDSARSALEAAVVEHDRRRIQDEERQRLVSELGAVATLPLLASPHLTRQQVEYLAGLLLERDQAAPTRRAPRSGAATRRTRRPSTPAPRGSR